MPDRWGRINGDDWNSATNMINSLQAMGQRNKEFKQGQEDREEKKAEKKQYRSAMVAMANGEEMPEGTPQDIVVKAKQTTAQGFQADDIIKAGKDKKEVEARQGKILQWIDANGIDSIDKIPTDLTAGIIGQKGLAAAIALKSSTAEEQKKLMQARAPVLEEGYKKFDNARKYVSAAISSGKMDEAITGLQQMSKDIKIPYQLGNYDPESKSFELLYYDRRSGALQPAGLKPLQEVLTEMNGMGKKQYFAQVSTAMETKRLENLKAEANPYHGKTKDGTSVLITPQIQVWNPDGGVTVRVKNEKTGELLTEYPSWEEFYNSGSSVENLDREKKLAEIDATEALTTSRNKDASANSWKATKQQFDAYGKQFDSYLELFGGGGSAVDEDGEITLEGLLSEKNKNAFSAAQDFMYQHKDDYQTLEGKEKLMFQSAVKADQLYRFMLNGFKQAQSKPVADDGGQQKPPGKAYTIEQAKKMGAKQDGQGRWLVPSSIPGKAKVINVVSSDPSSMGAAGAEIEKQEESAMQTDTPPPPAHEEPHKSAMKTEESSDDKNWYTEREDGVRVINPSVLAEKLASWMHIKGRPPSEEQLAHGGKYRRTRD